MPSNKFLTDKENPLVPSERAHEAAIRSQRLALQHRLMHGEVLESIAQTIEDGLRSEDISVRLSTVDRWHKLTESAGKGKPDQDFIDITPVRDEALEARADAQALRAHYQRLTDEEFAEQFPSRYEEWQALLVKAEG